MYVWSYWEGPMPFYIEVCLRSLIYTCSSFVWVTPDVVRDYLKPYMLHPNYLKLPQPALRADCIRAGLLAYYGGFWYDADTIGLTDPLKLVQNNTQVIYTNWDTPPFRILNGYLYTIAGNAVIFRWLEEINRALRTDYTSVSWCSLGEKILTELLVSAPGAQRVERNTFLPIDIDSNVRDFFSTQDYRQFIKPNTVCYGLNHSYFMYHHKKEMELASEFWNSSPLLIHQLLASAL